MLLGTTVLSGRLGLEVQFGCYVDDAQARGRKDGSGVGRSKYSTAIPSQCSRVTMIMPRGPKGEKRPADAIGNAVMIARIATGEIEDITTEDGKNAAAVALGRMGGKAPCRWYDCQEAL